jgi:branched-chain amino acid transport system substrate-binding protein
MLMYDTPEGAFFGKHFRKSAQRLGYTFLIDEPLPPFEDYLPLIHRLKKADIDSILIFGDPADCIIFVRQMKQAGLNLKYFHGWKGTWTVEFWKALKQDAQYVVSDGFWSEDYPYPGAKRLGDLFYERFDKRSVSVGLYYAGCQILFKAIEAAGTLDGAAIRKAVIETEFKDTVLGDINYNSQGAAYFESTANQWWNQELRWFYPFKKGAWTFKTMPPWADR